MKITVLLIVIFGIVISFKSLFLLKSYLFRLQKPIALIKRECDYYNVISIDYNNELCN